MCPRHLTSLHAVVILALEVVVDDDASVAFSQVIAHEPEPAVVCSHIALC